MRILIRRFTTAAVLASTSFATIAAEPKLAFEPFLDCAGAHVYHRYLAEAADRPDDDALQALDKQILFYLQIAESLSQRSLRKEFVDASASEAQRAQKVMKAGGSDAYLTYYTDRKNECGRLVKEHQSEIMDAVNAVYESQEQRSSEQRR